MAFNTKSFIEQARAKGIPDDQTLKYLQDNNLIPQATPTARPSVTEQGIGGLPFVKQATEFAAGAGTAVGKAALGIPEAGLRIAGAGAGMVGASGAQSALTGAAEKVKGISQAIYEEPSAVANTPSGTAGKVVGTVAPYLMAGGPISSLANKSSGLLKGAGVLSAVGRTATAATTEGLLNYGLAYGLTGGDTETAKWAGITAGTLKAATAGTGEVLKGMKADEALMNTIYKTSKDEARFQLFGKEPGKTLAQDALDHGITGNAKNQAIQISEGYKVAEQKIGDELMKAGNPEITLTDPMRYMNALSKEAAWFRNSGANKTADEIESVASVINDEGKVKATDALSLRRLIDGFTNFRESMPPTKELGYEQAGFREMGTELRTQINKVGKVGEAMKDYQFYISAQKALIKYARASANRAVLDVFDKLLLGESLMSSNPYGAALVAGSKLAKKAGATSAQFIKNLPTSSALGAGTRAAIAPAIGSLTSTQ